MEKKETPDNNYIHASSEKQGPKTISRRKVIKSLMLLPIQVSLFQSVIKAEGTASPFPGVKDIHGDNYPGIPEI
jgi:hypothetical protein